MRRRNILLGLIGIAVLAGGQVSTLAGNHRNGKEVRFTVRIENVSSPDGQVASNGAKWPFALSPGMWITGDKEVTLFKEGKPALANGLEAQAEDGDPGGLIKSLEDQGHKLHGVFNTPNGSEGPGPIGPGGSYEFTVTAAAGMKLWVVMMFGQSNDYFYAPSSGIAIFDKSGRPTGGDVTSKFVLWDAGTEVDQEPGIGSDQAPRQAAHNIGDGEHGVVHKAKNSTFFSRTGELFKVTITPQGEDQM
jgi:hypothetical protein